MPRKKTTILLNRAVCKACGICAALCPKNAFALDEEGKPFMKSMDSCVGCALCEMRCPDMALRIKEVD